MGHRSSGARTVADGTPGAAFSYDDAGRVLSIVNTNSALSYAFDDAGRLLSETQALAGQPQAHTVNYGWDDDGRPAALGYPSGLEVAYAYGARGLMSGVSAGGATLAGIVRDADGRRAVLALANGTQTAYSFDAASQLTALAHANSGGAFATRGYDYNSIGLRTNMLSGIAGVGNVLDDYAHDPLDQLVRARYDVTGGTPQRDVQYNFDGVGNRLSVDDNGAVTSYAVNDLNQYTSVAGLALTYSTNGNLVGGPGFALTYDAQNRLVQAAAATGTVTFAYDGRNRVVRRTVTPAGEVGTSVWFVWGHAQSGQWGLLEERDSAGNLAARYVHGERIDEMLRREGPEGTFFYHQDALGSTVALTDGIGALVEQYRYDVYGQPSIFDATGQPLAASAVGNRFLFTGRGWLPELGLYDFRNRVYSPVLGRWLQPDPIGLAAGDENLYRYCGNLPSLTTDADGLIIRLRRDDTVSLVDYFRLCLAYWAARDRLDKCGHLTVGAQRLRSMDADKKHVFTITARTTREGGWFWESDKLKASTPGVGSGGDVYVNVASALDGAYPADGAPHDLESLIIHELAGHGWLSHIGALPWELRPGLDNPYFRASERYATSVENLQRKAKGIKQREKYGNVRDWIAVPTY